MDRSAKEDVFVKVLKRIIAVRNEKIPLPRDRRSELVPSLSKAVRVFRVPRDSREVMGGYCTGLEAGV